MSEQLANSVQAFLEQVAREATSPEDMAEALSALRPQWKAPDGPAVLVCEGWAIDRIGEAESAAAALERAHDRERTGRLQAEERVRKLEAAVTKAYWDLADGDGFAMDILKRAHPRVDEGEEEASAGGES